MASPLSPVEELKPHPCLLDDGTFEHDYEVVEVDNGDGIWHHSSCHYECRQCGECAPYDGDDVDEWY